jgi:hypothetical protein
MAAPVRAWSGPSTPRNGSVVVLVREGSAHGGAGLSHGVVVPMTCRLFAIAAQAVAPA